MAKRKNTRRKAPTKSSANPLALALSQHAFHAKDTLSRLLHSPFSSLMTILVIAIALALPACLYVIVNNAQTLTERWQTTHDISVYIKGSSSLENVEELKKSLMLRKDVQLVRVISSEQALNEIKEESQLDLISEAIGKNPLPHTLIVSPSEDLIKADSDKEMNVLLTALKKLPRVSEVQLDAQWVMKFRSIVTLLKRIVWLLSALLALGVLLVVSNTIRLHVQQRENEIQVKKLIGASNDFVRRPFLYIGFWYGFLGAIVACLLVLILMGALSGPAARLSELYASNFTLHGLGLTANITLIIFGTCLALLGSWIAADHTIKHIEVV